MINWEQVKYKSLVLFLLIAANVWVMDSCTGP